MSALTDLFSAFANKIRSNLGVATTYTPLEMVDAIDEVGASTSLTPSDSSPASMTSGVKYKPTAAGYAITSFSSVTPSSSGAAFSAGMVKMSSSGYAYDSQQSSGPYSNKYGNGSSTMSSTAYLSNLKKGKHYLILAYGANTTNIVNTTYDGVTATNGTLTKINNIITVGARHAAGTAYDFLANSTNAAISLPNNGWVQVYEC